MCATADKDGNGVIDMNELKDVVQGWFVKVQEKPKKSSSMCVIS